MRLCAAASWAQLIGPRWGSSLLQTRKIGREPGWKMETGQSEWFWGETGIQGRAGQLTQGRAEVRGREGEETGAGVMIHPEVDVIGSQSLCGPRVERRKKRMLGYRCRHLHSTPYLFLATGDWSCLYSLGLLKPPPRGVESGPCGCPRTGR